MRSGPVWSARIGFVIVSLLSVCLVRGSLEANKGLAPSISRIPHVRHHQYHEQKRGICSICPFLRQSQNPSSEYVSPGRRYQECSVDTARFYFSVFVDLLFWQTPHAYTVAKFDGDIEFITSWELAA